MFIDLHMRRCERGESGDHGDEDHTIIIWSSKFVYFRITTAKSCEFVRSPTTAQVFRDTSCGKWKRNQSSHAMAEVRRWMSSRGRSRRQPRRSGAPKLKVSSQHHHRRRRRRRLSFVCSSGCCRQCFSCTVWKRWRDVAWRNVDVCTSSVFSRMTNGRLPTHDACQLICPSVAPFLQAEWLRRSRHGCFLKKQVSAENGARLGNVSRWH